MTAAVRTEVQRLVPAPPRLGSMFADLVREHVSTRYPGTERDYGARLFNEHLSGAVTSNASVRRVWSVCDSTGAPAAFACATVRWDRSVKIGPLVAVPGARQGAAAQLLEALAEHYTHLGSTFLYGTYPASHRAVRALVAAAGWSVVGGVAGLYRDDEEVLCHKILGGLRGGPKPPNSGSPDRTYEIPKRGGSIAVKCAGDPARDILEQAVDRAIQKLPTRRRVVFARVLGEPSFYGSSESLPLCDGSRVHVWRP